MIPVVTTTSWYRTQSSASCYDIFVMFHGEDTKRYQVLQYILAMFEGLHTRRYQVLQYLSNVSGIKHKSTRCNIYIYIYISNILGIRSVHTRCYNILVMFQVLEFDTTILNIPGVKLVVLQYVGDVSEREKSETEWLLAFIWTFLCLDDVSETRHSEIPSFTTFWSRCCVKSKSKSTSFIPVCSHSYSSVVTVTSQV